MISDRLLQNTCYNYTLRHNCEHPGSPDFPEDEAVAGMSMSIAQGESGKGLEDCFLRIWVERALRLLLEALACGVFCP